MTLLHFPLHRTRAEPRGVAHRTIAPLLRLACAQLRKREAAAQAHAALVAQWRRSPSSGRLECRWVRVGAVEEPPGRIADARRRRPAHPLRRSEARSHVRVPSVPAVSAGAAARALVAQCL